ncbi:MAG: hypothetical protein JWQ41_2585, partial [Variovorax sp.]|nr:hypothetical protein [Variovorax sp.]
MPSILKRVARIGLLAAVAATGLGAAGAMAQTAIC